MAEQMKTELRIWLNGKTEILNSNQLTELLPRFKAPFAVAFQGGNILCLKINQTIFLP